MNSSSAARALPRGLRALVAALLAASVAAAAFALAPAAAAVSAAESDPVTWAVRTASNELGSARTNFSYTIDPGATVADAIVVTNRGDEAVDLKLYAADGSTSEQGELSLTISDDEPQAVGAWIVPELSEITLDPGAELSVPFTVSVPDGATPGDYAGGFVTSLTVPDAEAGVNVDRRLAMRVSLRVGGTLAPGLVAENVSVGWDGGLNPFAGGEATITYTLRNTGNAAVSAIPSGRIAGVFGWFGSEAAEAAEVPRLLPGESWTQSVTIADVPSLVMLFGSVTVTPLVTDPAGSTSPMADVTVEAMGWAVPWTLLLLIVVLAVAAFLIVRTRRRQLAAAKLKAAAEVDAAVERALEQERAKAAQGVEA